MSSKARDVYGSEQYITKMIAMTCMYKLFNTTHTSLIVIGVEHYSKRSLVETLRNIGWLDFWCWWAYRALHQNSMMELLMKDILNIKHRRRKRGGGAGGRLAPSSSPPTLPTVYIMNSVAVM